MIGKNVHVPSRDADERDFWDRVVVSFVGSEFCRSALWAAASAAGGTDVERTDAGIRAVVDLAHHLAEEAMRVRRERFPAPEEP